MLLAGIAFVEDANQEERRMQDEVSRLLGIDGMALTAGADRGWWVAQAGE